MEKFALIMAGGIGSRMGSDVPKQFIAINGKPVILHSINKFLEFHTDIKIIIVLPEDQYKKWNECCKKYKFDVPHTLAPGGSERFFSVRNGLDRIDREGIVFIHDAVRPMVSCETIARCHQCAIEKGNAVPVWPVSESLRKKTAKGSKAVDRSDYFIVQTPQTFIVSLIKKIYEQEYRPEFTDDASVFESSGKLITMVRGNRENIKITYPEDMKIARLFL